MYKQTLEEKYRMMCMTLLKHRYLYYILNEPQITDTEYDKLEQDTKKLEEENPSIKHKDSPTSLPGNSIEQSYPKSIRMMYKVRLEKMQKKCRKN